jgi:hypothetical protein
MGAIRDLNADTNLVIVCNGYIAGNITVVQSEDGIRQKARTDVDKFILGATSPALAELGDQLVMAWVGDATGNLRTAMSTDGFTWSDDHLVHQASNCGPALALFHDQLIMAFVVDLPSGNLLVSTSSDGITWSDNHLVHQASGFGPALAVFHDQLVMAFVVDLPSGNLLVSTSSDGITWSDNHLVHQASNAAPALGVIGDTLIMAFLADDAAAPVLACSSKDGVNWSGNTVAIPSTAWLYPNSIYSSVSLATFLNQLFLWATADDGGNVVATTADGVTWSAPTSAYQLYYGGMAAYAFP